MTNPFADISDPATLRALVQDGDICNMCSGWGKVAEVECYDCNGTGHTPLSNADLDALAACWCEGEWVEYRYGHWFICRTGYKVSVLLNGPSNQYNPTTSPDAAMRLQEKYRLSLHPCVDSFDNVAWQAFSMEHTETIHSKIDGRKSKCQVLTECALVAALTEAIEGARQQKEE